MNMQLIQELIAEELETSRQIHETEFSGIHEAESIIREELEESEEALQEVRTQFEELHKRLREDDLFGFIHATEDIYHDTLHTITELIQLAAMCKKTQLKPLD